tara:strand:- start:216 stop:476 length:261 start_codon:yes stop_codon:yes gene_type:complete
MNKKLHPYVQDKISWLERMVKDLKYTTQVMENIIEFGKEKNFLTNRQKERIKLMNKSLKHQVDLSIELRKKRKKKALKNKQRRQYI